MCSTRLSQTGHSRIRFPTFKSKLIPSYLLPHFLTTDIARVGEQLYLVSEYFAPEPGKPDTREDFPQARFWNRMVVRDPRIRVKIGNQLFDMRAYPLTDPAEIEAARAALLSKYTDVRQREAWPEPRRPALHFFWLEPHQGSLVHASRFRRDCARVTSPPLSDNPV